MSPEGMVSKRFSLLGTSFSFLTLGFLILLFPGACWGADRRSDITGCYDSTLQLFEQTCSRNWEPQDFITLQSGEEFDGKDYELNIVTGFTGGVLAVDESSVTSFNEAPFIHNLRLTGGSINMDGGYVMQKGAKFFHIHNCSASGPISGNGAGGIVGSEAGSNGGNALITHSFYTGAITGIGSGGIVGKDAATNGGKLTIKGCYSVAAIEGVNAGGILGANGGSAGGYVNITYCHSKGDVLGPDAGGIAGVHAGTGGTMYISKSYSTGRIQGENAGGLCGSSLATNKGNIDISDSYTRGEVAGLAAGGLVGASAGAKGSNKGRTDIKDSYASGMVSAGAGGLFGTISSGSPTIYLKYIVHSGGVCSENPCNPHETGNSNDLNDIINQIYCVDDNDDDHCWDEDIWTITAEDQFPILRPLSYSSGAISGRESPSPMSPLISSSATVSASSTKTSSATMLSTLSATGTSTFSLTLTSSPTTSSTITRTSTRSSIKSSTLSPTVSSTISSTSSLPPSSTSSSTMTMTSSVSHSSSVSSTMTRTSSSSSSATVLLPLSSTASASTFRPSVTNTQTRSASSSAILSTNSTVSLTRTSSVSCSSTMSTSQTASYNTLSTISASWSSTLSPSPSPSANTTKSFSFSPTLSSTITGTSSVSSSSTLSPLATVTRTSSASSPSVTLSPSTISTRISSDTSSSINSPTQTASETKTQSNSASCSSFSSPSLSISSGRVFSLFTSTRSSTITGITSVQSSSSISPSATARRISSALSSETLSPSCLASTKKSPSAFRSSSMSPSSSSSNMTFSASSSSTVIPLQSVTPTNSASSSSTILPPVYTGSVSLTTKSSVLFSTALSLSPSVNRTQPIQFSASSDIDSTWTAPVYSSSALATAFASSTALDTASPSPSAFMDVSRTNSVSLSFLSSPTFISFSTFSTTATSLASFVPTLVAPESASALWNHRNSPLASSNATSLPSELIEAFVSATVLPISATILPEVPESAYDPEERDIDPHRVIVTHMRRNSSSTSGLVSKDVHLTLKARDKWTWHIPQHAANYIRAPEDGETLTSLTIVQLVVIDFTRAPLGERNVSAKVVISNKGLDVIQFSLNLVTSVREAFTSSSVEKIALSRSLSESEISRTVTIFNNGDLSTFFCAQILGSDGHPLSNPWARLNYACSSSSPLVELPANDYMDVDVTFDAGLVPSTGLFHAWLLISTDAWDGRISDSLRPPIPKCYMLNGSRLWVKAELLVTTVFICPPPSVTSDLLPLQERRRSFTVLNTGIKDIRVMVHNFTIRELNAHYKTFYVCPQILGEKGLTLGSGLWVSPLFRPISTGISAEFSFDIVYIMPQLKVWTSEGAVTSTASSFEVRFAFFISNAYNDMPLVQSTEIRSGAFQVNLSPGNPTNEHSLVDIQDTFIPVKNTTEMLIDLRDMFGNTDAVAKYVGIIDSSEKEQPNSLAIVTTLGTGQAGKPFRFSSNNPLVQGSLVSSLHMKVEAIVAGRMKVDVRLNGRSVKGSPFNLTSLPIQCFGVNEVPDASGVKCLCRAGFYRTPSNCLPCPEGTHSRVASNEETCQACPVNHFSESGASLCFRCGEHQVTCSNGKLRLKQGSWCELCAVPPKDQTNTVTRRDIIVRRLQEGSDLIFHQCRGETACVVDPLEFRSECGPGHIGPVCDSCSDGYKKDLTDNSCFSCDKYPENVFLTALGFSVLLVAIAVIAYRNLPHRQMQIGQNKANPSDGFTIIMSSSLEEVVLGYIDYLQILAILDAMNLAPFRETEALQWLSSLTDLSLLNPTRPKQFRCLMQTDVHTSLLIAMSFPIPVAVTVIFVQELVYVLKFRRFSSLRKFLMCMLPTMFRFLEFVHASVTAAATRSLIVYGNEIDGSKRLDADLNILVGDRRFLALQLAAWVVLVSFVFGFPCIMSLYLGDKFHKARKRGNRVYARLQRRFENIIGGFNPDRSGYFWPQISIVRKVLLTFVSIYSSALLHQLAWVSGILLASYFICVRMRPHMANMATHVELFNTASACMTAGLGTVLVSLPNSWRTSLLLVEGMIMIIQVSVFLMVSTGILVFFPYAFREKYLKLLYYYYGLRRFWLRLGRNNRVAPMQYQDVYSSDAYMFRKRKGRGIHPETVSLSRLDKELRGVSGSNNTGPVLKARVVTMAGGISTYAKVNGMPLGEQSRRRGLAIGGNAPAMTEGLHPRRYCVGTLHDQRYESRARERFISTELRRTEQRDVNKVKSRQTSPLTDNPLNPSFRKRDTFTTAMQEKPQYNLNARWRAAASGKSYVKRGSLREPRYKARARERATSSQAKPNQEGDPLLEGNNATIARDRTLSTDHVYSRTSLRRTLREPKYRARVREALESRGDGSDGNFTVLIAAETSVSYHEGKNKMPEAIVENCRKLLHTSVVGKRDATRDNLKKPLFKARWKEEKERSASSSDSNNT